MSMKAVLITKDNQESLSSRYLVNDVEDEMPIGYVLIVDFGVEDHFDLVTVRFFNRHFKFVGRPLKNDFSEIVQTSDSFW